MSVQSFGNCNDMIIEWIYLFIDKLVSVKSLQPMQIIYSKKKKKEKEKEKPYSITADAQTCTHTHSIEWHIVRRLCRHVPCKPWMKTTSAVICVPHFGSHKISNETLSISSVSSFSVVSLLLLLLLLVSLVLWYVIAFLHTLLQSLSSK